MSATAAQNPIANVLSASRPRLLRRLGSAWPTTDPALVEDALQQAALELLCRPLEGGFVRLEGLLYTVAWRRLRGDRRRTRSRAEVSMAHVPAGAHADHPGAWLEARERAEHVQQSLPLAARRFAARRPERLRAALEDRVYSGDSDVDVARRHGVDRSALCRSRAWLERRSHAAGG